MERETDTRMRGQRYAINKKKRIQSPKQVKGMMGGEEKKAGRVSM
jgi:hypothetical protein